MVQGCRGKVTNRACERTRRADWTVRGLAVRSSWIGRSSPHKTMLSWIRHTQHGDIAIACGCAGRNGSDRLRGNSRRKERGESDILAIGSADCVRGISADMIQRA